MYVIKSWIENDNDIAILSTHETFTSAYIDFIKRTHYHMCKEWSYPITTQIINITKSILGRKITYYGGWKHTYMSMEKIK